MPDSARQAASRKSRQSEAQILYDEGMLQVHPDAETLGEQVAKYMTEVAMDFESGSRRLRVLLAGGNTPRAVYRRLAELPDIEWSQWDLFIGDERNVPPDHPDSNHAMIKETLIDPLAARGLKPHRFVRWRTEWGPARAAEHYHQTLRAMADDGIAPRFDFVLLGMGTDGHTAGLFPGTSALDEHDLCAVVNPVPQLDTVRLTVTLPVLLNAEEVTILVAGAEKAATVHRAINLWQDNSDLPIVRLRERDEITGWELDAAAARLLHIELEEP